MSSVERELAAAITATPAEPLILGNVVSVGADETITATVRGGTVTGIRFLAHVTPRPGFGVWLQRVGTDLIAVGSMAQHGYPACRVRRANDQTLTDSGTEYALSWDTQVFDPWDMWTSGANVTIPIPGLWEAVAGVRFGSNGTGLRDLRIRCASTTIANVTLAPSSAGSPTRLSAASGVFEASAGDAINALATQTSGGSLNVIGDQVSFLSVRYVGPIG